MAYLLIHYNLMLNNNVLLYNVLYPSCTSQLCIKEGGRSKLDITKNVNYGLSHDFFSPFCTQLSSFYFILGIITTLLVCFIIIVKKKGGRSEVMYIKLILTHHKRKNMKFKLLNEPISCYDIQFRYVRLL